VTEEAVQAINECSNIVKDKLAQGEIIYGVNTGFGGSADQRSDAVDSLQQRLFTLLMAGVTSTGGSDLNVSTVSGTTCMPEAWVRASMVVRLNSLAAGASGVRIQITDRLSEMLNHDIVPLVPIRGSISASGDLSPLAYIGGVLQGKKYLSAFVGPRGPQGERKLLRADVALAQANLPPLGVQAKEGLAIVNGTAVSAGVAALAAYECTNLAALSQVLTAMTVEALCGPTKASTRSLPKCDRIQGRRIAHGIYFASCPDLGSSTISQAGRCAKTDTLSALRACGSVLSWKISSLLMLRFRRSLTR